MLFKKLRIVWEDYKFWITVVLVLVFLSVLSVFGLAFLDSYYRMILVATTPFEMLKMMVFSIVSAYFFVVLVYRGGFTMGKVGQAIQPRDIKVGFKDVIGLTEAKREAMEVVELIKDRAKVRKIGGKVIRGLLMIGPPGCGKTYMAKAIAKESGVPFLSISGSEFVEVFVGVGASRVRSLFKKAKALAYVHGSAIIFIDELDAIGQQRKFSFMGSSESDSTLNQILVNMDGLNEEMGGQVIVIGATNANESTLDPAILRPGRFDRHIYVSPPRLKDRIALLEYYTKKVKIDETVDLGRLARRCVTKSPADIENIVKEAALISLRNSREILTYKDFSAAIERVDMGLETQLEYTPLELEQTAYHEAGHAILTYLENPTDDVFKVSVKSRGGALGLTYHSPREELHSASRQMMYARIKASLAGFAAEKVKYGYTTSGVSDDFRHAMQAASAMVWRLGMGAGGFVGDYTMLLGTATGRDALISDQMKDRLTLEVHAILKKAGEETEALLIKEKTLLDAFAQSLIEHKELDYDEIEEIFRVHGKAREQV